MKIKITSHNKTIEASPGQSVMEACQKNDVYIKSVCNGQARCTECRIKVLKGENNISNPSQKELDQIGSGYFLDQRRLSCQMFCYGDIEIDLSEQIQKEKVIEKITVSDMKEGNVEDNTSFAVRKRIIEEDDF